jgi:hypothetical protein
MDAPVPLSPAPREPDPRETAAYAAALLAGLADLAEASGLERLAALVDAAHAQARRDRARSISPRATPRRTR